MELQEGVTALGAAAYIEPLDMLIVADLQLGREEELRSHGHMVFDRELSSMKRRLSKALKHTGAKRLLINGDIKHEFSRINKQEWHHVLALLDFFREHGVEVILVKGNHDNMLEPIARKHGYAVVDYHLEEGYLFCHGHELPAKEALLAHTIIIGHEHPAVRLDDGVRSESAKCFLVGHYKKKRLIVLPSYSEVTQGTDIIQGKSLGPFMGEKKKFAVFVLVEDSVLRFGTVKDITTAMNMNGGD